MNLFGRSGRGLFASASLTGHLLRGGVAVGLIIWAIDHQAEPARALIAGVAALAAFRGCPMCWTIGLIETVAQKLKGGPQVDTRQSTPIRKFVSDNEGNEHA